MEQVPTYSLKGYFNQYICNAVAAGTTIAAVMMLSDGWFCGNVRREWQGSMGTSTVLPISRILLVTDICTHITAG